MESNFTMYLYNAWLPEWFTKIKKFFYFFLISVRPSRRGRITVSRSSLDAT